MRDSGMTQSAVVEALNISQSVVSRLLNKQETWKIADRPRSGRPKLTNKLLRVSSRNRFAFAESVRYMFRERVGIVKPSSSVNKRLLRTGLYARRHVVRARLTPRHCPARLQFASDHQAWRLRFWRRVLWSDESRLFLSPRRPFAGSTIDGQALQARMCRSDCACGWWE